MEGMQFVYSLSHNGNVFYIGRTKDLLKRYKQHLSGSESLAVSVFVKRLIDEGHTPIMLVLDYLPIQKAVNREEEIIKLITKAGHNLLNGPYTYIYAWKDEMPPSDLTKDNMLSYLKYMQKTKEDTYAFWAKIENKVIVNE